MHNIAFDMLYEIVLHANDYATVSSLILEVVICLILACLRTLSEESNASYNSS